MLPSRQSKEVSQGVVTRKINLDKVRASLDTVCPKCGKAISPAEVRRVDFQRIECPVCGEQFAPGKVNSQPSTRFEYKGPEAHRDPVSSDERFLRACGVRPPNVRDELHVLDR